MSKTTSSPGKDWRNAKKPRISAFSSAAPRLDNKLDLKTTKPRAPRESATAPKFSTGSTFAGGHDPFHAIIVEHGEPKYWTQMREFNSRSRSHDAMQSIEPPDPQFYWSLGEGSTPLSSGLDVNQEPIDGEEFWAKLGEAWEKNLDGEESRWVWEFGGEYRRGIGSLLCEEREREEEREEEELLGKLHEVESLGG